MTTLAKVYLDTSAIRGLGAKLNTTTADNLCTSALTLVELATSAARSTTERSFRSAQTALRVAMNGKIEVDWRLPEEPMHMSFGWMRQTMKFTDDRLASLREIVACLADATSNEDFKSKVAAKSLAFPLDYWVQFDASFGATYIEATVAANQGIKSAFEKAKRGEGRSDYLPADVLKLTYRQFCLWFVQNEKVLNRSTTIHALAQRGRLLVPSAPENLGDTYEGTIDSFIDAFSLRAMLDAGESRTPARNDALDLAHFLFIADGMSLATGDARMKETAEGVGIRALDPNSLLNSPAT